MAKKMVVASLFKRFVAFFVDITLLSFAVSMPFEKFVNLPSNIGDAISYLETNPQIYLKLIIVTSLMSILTILYFSIMEFYTKQTIGKMLMGIFVVDIENKKSVKFRRYLISNLSMFSDFIFLLDSIYILFNSDKQRFLEKLTRLKQVQNEKK